MEKLMSYLRELWLFLSSRIFLSNIIKMLAVVVVLFLMTNWWMRCYTNHGESVQVDDFTGLIMKDAVKKGKNKGFQFEVIDSSWQLGKPGGIILNQTPKPFSRVKEGRKIYLTVTTYGTETVRLPEFSNYAYDFSEYQKRLKILQITAKETEKVFDRRQAPGTIVHFYFNGKKITENDVKKGVEIPKGSVLEFTVTDRQSNRVNLPDLVCQTFDAADFLVGSYNLNIGQINEDETVTDRFSAYVYRQEPAFVPETTIQMGTQINVWLSQDLPDDCNQ